MGELKGILVLSLVAFLIIQNGNGMLTDPLQRTTPTTDGREEGVPEALPEEVLHQLLWMANVTSKVFGQQMSKELTQATAAIVSTTAAATASAAATTAAASAADEPVIQRLLLSLLEAEDEKIQLRKQLLESKNELLELRKELATEKEEKEEEKWKCEGCCPCSGFHPQPPPLSLAEVQVPSTLEESMEHFQEIQDTMLKAVWDIRENMIGCERLPRDPERQREPWPSDCYDLFQNGIKKSGVHSIHPKTLNRPEGVRVWCDMGEGEAADEAEREAEDGGWTVIIKRQPLPDQVNFTRFWADYKHGFGNPETEYYIGNDVLHAMTTGGKPQVLRTDIVDWDNQTSFAIYNRFSVGDEASNYLLSVGDYSTLSSAGDSFGNHDGMKFSTPDKDNDIHDDRNCAKNNKGSFWFSNCWQVSPTLPLLPKDEDENTYGIEWGKIDGKWINRRGISMKIRTRN